MGGHVAAAPKQLQGSMGGNAFASAPPMVGGALGRRQPGHEPPPDLPDDLREDLSSDDDGHHCEASHAAFKSSGDPYDVAKKKGAFPHPPSAPKEAGHAAAAPTQLQGRMGGNAFASASPVV